MPCLANKDNWIFELAEVRLAILPIFLTLSQNVPTWHLKRMSTKTLQSQYVLNRLSTAHPWLMAWEESTTMVPNYPQTPLTMDRICSDQWTNAIHWIGRFTFYFLKRVLQGISVQGWQTHWVAAIKSALDKVQTGIDVWRPASINFNCFCGCFRFWTTWEWFYNEIPKTVKIEWQRL